MSANRFGPMTDVLGTLVTLPQGVSRVPKAKRTESPSLTGSGFFCQIFGKTTLNLGGCGARLNVIFQPSRMPRLAAAAR